VNSSVSPSCLLPGSCLQAYTVLRFIILVLQAPHVLSCLCCSLNQYSDFEL
jgi:hypothetical protein